MSNTTSNRYAYWDTIMEYLPYYHQRDDVLLSDTLLDILTTRRFARVTLR